MTDSSQIPFRPLGLIRELLESLGHQVTHCYEDLVFTEHNAFLLKMEDKGENISLFFNQDYEKNKRESLAQELYKTGQLHSLSIKLEGTYSVIPDEENQTIDIHFHPSKK